MVYEISVGPLQIYIDSLLWLPSVPFPVAKHSITPEAMNTFQWTQNCITSLLNMLHIVWIYGMITVTTEPKSICQAINREKKLHKIYEEKTAILCCLDIK